MKIKKVLILGAGAFAREVCHWASQTGRYEVAGFFDDFNLPTDNLIIGKRIYSDFDSVKKDNIVGFIIGVGDPFTKERLFNNARTNDLEPVTIIHPTVQICDDSEVDEGCVLCPNVVITTNVHIKQGVVLNIGVTVGHDCKIGSFSTVSPQVAISGNCKIGSRVFFGTNSAIREKVDVCSDIVVGMGAIVVNDIYQLGTYVGCPAKRVE